MLRHLRRDRFAPHLPLEREHREAAFAHAEDRKVVGVEGVENNSRFPSQSPDARETLKRISDGTHYSTEALLSLENPERIYESVEALDGLIDIAHPSQHVEEILQNAMERMGIKIEEGADPSEELDKWMEEARRKHTLSEENIVKARAEILRNVTNDPEALIALIRSLERQRTLHERLVISVEKTTPEGKSIDAETKHGILSRAEAAQAIRAIVRSGQHESESVQRWMAQARPEEIRYLLDIQEPKSPGTLRRGINLLADWSKRLGHGMSRWHPDTGNEPDDREKITEQKNYFAKVDSTINGLRSLLKAKLEERANALAKRIDLDMLRGLAAAAGISVSASESEQEIRQKLSGTAKEDFDSPDGRIAKQFERTNGITIEDATEETNTFVKRWKRARGLQIYAPDFIAKASDLLSRMEESDAGAIPDLWKHAIVEAQQRHDTVRKWIPEFQQAFKRIRPQLDDEAAASFVAMSTGAKDSDEVRSRLDELAIALENPNALERSELSYVQQSVSRLLPIIEKALTKDFRKAFGLSVSSAAPREFTEHADEVAALIESVQSDLSISTMQQSTACRVAGVPQKLAEQIQSATVGINRARTAHQSAAKDMSGEAVRKSASVQISMIGTEMKKMQDALIFIDTRIPKNAEETNRDCNGYCHYGEIKIYVNTSRHRVPPPRGILDEKALAETKDHEFGHLVIDALTERFHVFAGMFEEQERSLKSIAKERMGMTDESTLENLLEVAARCWGLDRKEITADGRKLNSENPDAAEAYYRRKRWEELLMQYADYCRMREENPEYELQKDGSMNQETKTLFHILDAERNATTTDASGKTVRENLLSTRSAVAYSRQQRAPTPEEEEAEAQERDRLRVENEEAANAKAFDPLRDLKKYRVHLKKIREFMNTYPEAASALMQSYTVFKSDYERLFNMFHTCMDDTKEPAEAFNPYTDETFKKRVRDSMRALEKINEQIKVCDNANLKKVNHLSPTNKDLWMWVTTDIQWLSIMDYWTIAKEGWEDLGRLWKRRGENARGKVGEMLTGWIGDKIPYLGQLKHEFHRRQQSSEQDAVGVWEKALENVDSYALIEQIPHVNNQDHLKALINLLTKRGRLDWENKELWESLSRYSHFTIPIEECHRDPILMDKYLQRVLSDIWNDKDLYRNWKTGNEHQYNSERNKFDGESDNLANMSALHSQLEYQLQTFCERPKNAPMPQSVNPHLYENMLVYAMKRGKMSMEAKFYYLIRGLQTELLPLDRLSIINSEISTKEFPFIDYFYGRNNTRGEIDEIAASITEKHDGKPTYKPGPNTTAFLMEEVCKDETARQRVFKVIDRKGDEIDHEDIPLVVAFASYGQLENFLQPMGGQKQRITGEGIKNGFVGYSSLFKVHAMQAKKRQEDGKRHMSPKDIEFLASRLVAYVHFDNIVVRQAAEKSGRPYITFEALNNETMPSGSGRTAAEFRERLSNFADAVFDAYRQAGLLNLTDDEIKQYLGRESKEAVQTKANTDKYSHAKKTLSEKNANDVNEKFKVFKLTEKVSDAMAEAVRQNNTIFEEVLIKFGNDDIKDDNTFINEGEDGDQLIYATHKHIFDRQERFSHANGGGGHGGGHP